MNYPPEYGPLAAVTPGTPGGICTMLSQYGTMSLKEVLAPAMQLAAGYPIEAQTANAGWKEVRTELKNGPIAKRFFYHIVARKEKRRSLVKFSFRKIY